MDDDNALRSLLWDTFDVAIAEEGKFENIKRIKAKSRAVEAELVLDVHSGLFDLQAGDVLTISFSANPTDQEKENAEYVMIGKVFREEAPEDQRNRVVYISFGGLLCSIGAEKEFLAGFILDETVVILIKRG